MAPSRTVVVGLLIGSLFQSLATISGLDPCKGSEKYSLGTLVVDSLPKAQQQCGDEGHLAYIETGADLENIRNSSCQQYAKPMWIGGNYANSNWNWADDWRPLREQGCFKYDSKDKIQHELVGVTADSCLSHCQNSSYKLAGIMNQTMCICSNVSVRERQQLTANECITPGCNDTEACGVALLSVGGTPTQWADQEPVHSELLSTKCVVMTNEYTWAMRQCKDNARFICEAGTGELTLGTFSTSWFGARNWCIEQGGDLITIKNKEKQKRIEDYLNIQRDVSDYWIGAKRFHLFWGPQENKANDMRFVAFQAKSEYFGEGDRFFLYNGHGQEYFTTFGKEGKPLCQEETLPAPTTLATTEPTNATDHFSMNVTTMVSAEGLDDTTPPSDSTRIVTSPMPSKPGPTIDSMTTTGGPESTTSFEDAKAAKTTGELATEYAAVIAVVILLFIIILSVGIACIHRTRRRHCRLDEWQVSFDSNLNSLHMKEKPAPSGGEDNIYDNTPGLRSEQPKPVESGYMDMSTLKREKGGQEYVSMDEVSTIREKGGQEYVAMDLPSGGSNVAPVAYSRKDDCISGVYDTPNEMNQYDEPEYFRIPRPTLSPQRNPLYDSPFTDWRDSGSLSTNDDMESSYSEIPRTVL